MTSAPITNDELRAAFKRSGLQMRGWTFERAIDDPDWLLVMRAMVRAERRKHQTNGNPAPQASNQRQSSAAAAGAYLRAGLDMRHFIVTIVNATNRIERSVIAPSTMAAIRIGIKMMPDLQGPVKITCKVAA